MGKLINGKEYPLWQQFVDRQSEFIGWDLIVEGNSMDAANWPGGVMKTKVIEITLEPNGKDSAFFSIVGKDFTCGFSTEASGLCNGYSIESGKEISFMGYGSHNFYIKESQKE